MLLCFTSLTAQDRRYLFQAYSFIKAKGAGTLGFESISQVLECFGLRRAVWRLILGRY